MSAPGVEEGALPPALGRPVAVALALALALGLAGGTLDAVRATAADPDRPEIVDFHAFHLAGRLALEGRFDEGYDPARMRALERDEGGGRDVFMPFAYPPTFGLIAAPLALLPVGPAFLLFAGGSLALYLGAMRWLCGASLGPTALAIAPALLIDLHIGQNGLLTGALAALAAGLSLRGRGGLAGVAAGLLAFKPQLAAGPALALLLRRDARAIGVAAAVAIAAAAGALALFGSGSAAAFRASLAYMERCMTAGTFPANRMVSTSACAPSPGATPAAALLAHAAAAACALALAAAARNAVDRAAGAGLCLMAGAFVSPYFYDYDLPAFAAGFALALPALSAALSRGAVAALLGAVGLAGAMGPLLIPLAGRAPGGALSLGGPVLLSAFAAAGAVLLRHPAGRPAVRRPVPAAAP